MSIFREEQGTKLESALDQLESECDTLRELLNDTKERAILQLEELNKYVQKENAYSTLQRFQKDKSKSDQEQMEIDQESAQNPELQNLSLIFEEFVSNQFLVFDSLNKAMTTQ